MDAPVFLRGGRGRGGIVHDSLGGRGRPHSRNKHWSAQDASPKSHTSNNADSERWERGGHRGARGRGHPRGAAPKFHNFHLNNTRHHTPTPEALPERSQQDNGSDAPAFMKQDVDSEDDGSGHLIQEPEFDTQDERDKFYQELVKARDTERKKAIAEGKMDDPLVPKRLEDAITIVGTCQDMCPRFERYRRERENNLFEWEMIQGTKRVDHNHAVKMYERGAGDRILPSDLRPPKVLKRTLDYLFHDLLPRGGFSPTFNFLRDRSRAVRNDFTMQRMTGPLAIECHNRCARFHILALHLQRDVTGFSIPLEEQQLMNTLQSLKEFYQDQRGTYQSPTELEMRVYHRLMHIRDQRERHDDIPEHIYSHPVFQLTTEFRQHVQNHSAPISKTSKLIVAEEGMQIFARLAGVLNKQGNIVMVYLVACILERHFGKDTIDDIEGLKGDLTIPQVIDGVSRSSQVVEVEPRFNQADGETDGEDEFEDDDEVVMKAEFPTHPPAPTPNFTDRLEGDVTQKQSSQNPTIPCSAESPGGNAFSSLVSQPNAFSTTNVFGNAVFQVPSKPSESPFANSSNSTLNFFGGRAFAVNPATSAQPEPTFFPPPKFTSFFPSPTSRSNGSLSTSVAQVSQPFGAIVSNTQETPAISATSPIGSSMTRAAVNSLSPTSSSSIPVPLNPYAEFTPDKNLPFVVPTPVISFTPVAESRSPTVSVQVSRSPSPKLAKEDIPLSTSSASSLHRPSSPPLSRISTSALKSPSLTRSVVFPRLPPPTPKLEIDVEEMRRKALVFAQKSLLIKKAFSRWLRRAMDRATWHEACRQGDAYQQKVASQSRHSPSLRSSSSRPEISPEKKRRVSNGDGVSPLRKRIRKKLTEYRPPQTDEELAKRFRENHQEHEQRWALGSFLGVIKQHVQSISPSALELPWDTWLSLNPECDATAIWLERKFGMPDSGAWFSGYVFSLPLSAQGKSNRLGYPGLIVFECTPVGDVSDDLERKYRVLDDCSRLRLVIESLPPKRHFIPSLLFIDWAVKESDLSIAPDILDMAKELVSKSIIQAYRVFAMTATTKDLDNKLQANLLLLPLDTQGRLVQSLELCSFLKILGSTFLAFLDEWLENCLRNRYIDWGLYGEVIKASIAIFNINSVLVHHILKTSNALEPLPPFNYTELNDSESVYGSIMDWLAGLGSGDLVRTIALDIQSYRDIGREFPMRVFMDHLWELTQVRLERWSPESTRRRPIPTSDLDLAVESYKEEIQAYHVKLLQVYNFNVRRSPKRRVSAVSSEQGSPQPKRPRLSPSLSSVNGDYLTTNGDSATSPVASTVSLTPTEGPTVTVSMLRALTEDLRNKYVSKP